MIMATGFMNSITHHKPVFTLKLGTLARQKPKKPSFEDLRNKVIHHESRGDSVVINSYGYMGLYQIGTNALEDIGLSKKVSLSKFRKNPDIFPAELQHRAFEQVIKNNMHYLRNYTHYIGDTIAGVVIDTSSLLMGAHGTGQMAV